ncbi:MAG: nitrogen regulatory protein P-II [Fimbriimonadales bacterium]|nr:MAG: nitrogen regulatory protein P-II [Fimbriimonadales bacterium]
MFVRIVAYIRPHKLEEVKTALVAEGVTGMTVTDARGTGTGGERSEWFRGKEHVISLPPRIKLEVIVPDALREQVIEAIVNSARTGREGDGKVFVLPELDVIRIRTGERGESAL